MAASDDPRSACGSALANRGALCSTSGNTRLEVMNEVIHCHFVYASLVIKSLEELTWKRTAFQRSGKENQSKINNQIIGQLPVSKHNKTKPGVKFYTSE